MLRHPIFLTVLLVLSACMDAQDSTQSASVRIDHGDFSPFVEVEDNKKNSHTFVTNPDGSNDVVERFYIDGTECRGVDCRYGSVRSAVRTDIWDDPRPRSVTSPQQAWYSFEIFFPEDTPIQPVQDASTISLASFKESNECASFAFVKNDNSNSPSEFNFFLAEYTGGLDSRFVGAPDECLSYYEAKIGNISNMLGKWVRFEYFVRWSEADDGYIVVYQDGVKVLERNGRTCQSTAQCLDRNIHIMGFISLIT